MKTTISGGFFIRHKSHYLKPFVRSIVLFLNGFCPHFSIFPHLLSPFTLNLTNYKVTCNIFFVTNYVSKNDHDSVEYRTPCFSPEQILPEKRGECIHFFCFGSQINIFVRTRLSIKSTEMLTKVNWLSSFIPILHLTLCLKIRFQSNEREGLSIASKFSKFIRCCTQRESFYL